MEYKFFRHSHQKYFSHLIDQRLIFIPYNQQEQKDLIGDYQKTHQARGWFAKKLTLKGLKLPSGAYEIEEFSQKTISTELKQQLSLESLPSESSLKKRNR